MIIQAIRAENFMKYASLRLTGLPARGVIGIEGPNESGKTTIGEAMLFAFFGKTRASLETSVSRLIRWGADYLSVEVEFSIPGRGEYLIYREIDKYGTNFVKVIDRATRAEVASGNVNVSEFLGRALQFDFYEFHQSFYHDQIQTGQGREAQSSFVDRMTGIAQIHDSLQGIKKDIEQLEREFAHYQKDIQRNLQQMEKYDRNAAKLPELRELARSRGEELEKAKQGERRRQEDCEAIKRLGEERQAVARRLDQLTEEPAGGVLTGIEEIRSGLQRLFAGSAVERDFAEKGREELQGELKRLESIQEMLREFQGLTAAYQELSRLVDDRLNGDAEASLVQEEARLQEELAADRGRRRRWGILALLSLLLGGAAAAGAAGAIPDLPRLLELPPETVRWGGAVVAGIFLILGVLALVAWVRARGKAGAAQEYLQDLSHRIREQTEEREKLRALLAVNGTGDVVRFIKASESISDRQVAEQRQRFLRTFGQLAEPEGEGEYRKVLQALSRSEREVRARAGRETQRAERAIQEAEAGVKKARGEVEKVENEIHECEAQAAKKEQLLGKNRDLQARSQEIRRNIELRRMAIELLDDTASTLRNKIGPALSRFMKELLPRLTRGRYRDVKVGSDLAVQVFTSDKSDFLDPTELSGGTHEALALGLRLATSQAFIAARSRQPQFVFLDEPFKMMDEARALEALQVLRELSSEIPQIFVIQPRFSPGQRAKFDSMIETAVAMAELEAPLSGRPEDQPAPDGADGSGAEGGTHGGGGQTSTAGAPGAELPR